MNERAAKCLEWEVEPYPDPQWYRDWHNKLIMLIDDFHPDTNRDHAHLLVEKVREEEKGLQFVDLLLRAITRDVGGYMTAPTRVGWLILNATPSQITEAAFEVLEQ